MFFLYLKEGSLLWSYLPICESSYLSQISRKILPSQSDISTQIMALLHGATRYTVIHIGRCIAWCCHWYAFSEEQLGPKGLSQDHSSQLPSIPKLAESFFGKCATYTLPRYGAHTLIVRRLSQWDLYTLPAIKNPSGP